MKFIFWYIALNISAEYNKLETKMNKNLLCTFICFVRFSPIKWAYYIFQLSFFFQMTFSFNTINNIAQNRCKENLPAFFEFNFVILLLLHTRCRRGWPEKTHRTLCMYVPIIHTHEELSNSVKENPQPFFFWQPPSREDTSPAPVTSHINAMF